MKKLNISDAPAQKVVPAVHWMAVAVAVAEFGQPAALAAVIQCVMG